MKVLSNLRESVSYGWEQLLTLGQKHESKNWQGVKAPSPMLEHLWLAFKAPMPPTIYEADKQLKPNQPWADAHFEERMGGVPLNPPPSHQIWPFNQKKNDEFIKDGVFDHTYPERFWPRNAGYNTPNNGIRFVYGDVRDVIIKLNEDPFTRQAYLPIWFPEDTGKPGDIRVPCSLGYHFIIRRGYLHITYMMRSVDMVRHFQDDLYLCYRLAYEVCGSLTTAFHVQLGYMNFLGINCHIFESDRQALEYKLKLWKNKE